MVNSRTSSSTLSASGIAAGIGGLTSDPQKQSEAAGSETDKKVRVKSGIFGHQVNSDTHLQTV